MSNKLRKVPTEDKSDNVNDDESGAPTSINLEGMTPEALQSLENAIAKIAKRNPFTRSQQYQEAVLDAAKKIAKGKDQDSDPDFVMEEGNNNQEGEDDSDDDDDSTTDEEKKENGRVDDKEISEDEVQELHATTGEQKVNRIEKRIRSNQSETFVKDVSPASSLNSFERVIDEERQVREKHTRKNAEKQRPQPKRSAAPRQKQQVESMSLVIGVEKPKKRQVGTSKQSSIKKVQTRNLGHRGTVEKSASGKRKREEYADSDSSSISCLLVSQKKKRTAEDEDDASENAFQLDLAPKEHKAATKKIRDGSVHIGQNVYVKWHKFRGSNFIMIRHIEGGIVDTRRGININMDYLPNLKKAIDAAYKCYTDAI